MITKLVKCVYNSDFSFYFIDTGRQQRCFNISTTLMDPLLSLTKGSVQIEDGSSSELMTRITCGAAVQPNMTSYVYWQTHIGLLDKAKLFNGNGNYIYASEIMDMTREIGLSNKWNSFRKVTVTPMSYQKKYRVAGELPLYTFDVSMNHNITYLAFNKLCFTPNGIKFVKDTYTERRYSTSNTRFLTEVLSAGGGLYIVESMPTYTLKNELATIK